MGLVWCILGAAVLLVCAAGWVLSGIVVHPRIHPTRECYAYELAMGTLTPALYEHGWAREDFSLTTPYGVRLHGTVVPRAAEAVPADGRERVVVLAHGYTSCLFGAAKYVPAFHALGFTCVLYDHRNHGDSAKAPTSMGWYEARELAAVCAYARGRFGENCVLGTHGESMGAATVMLHTALDDRLAFCVEDCGYSSLWQQLAYNMRHKYHLPVFPFLYLASGFAALRGGVRFSRVAPVEAVRQASALPMLFLHGACDSFVPTAMVQELCDAKPGAKRMRIFADARHAQSCMCHPHEYACELADFLLENGIVDERAAQRARALPFDGWKTAPNAPQ